MSKFIKNKKILSLFVFLGIFAIVSGVLALELVWPTSPGGTQLTNTTTLTEMVKYFYDWGIALGGLLAFLALISAGFQYLTSTGDPAKIKDAKDRISSAIAGLLLLLSSFLVLNTINPELTTLKTPTFAPPSQQLGVITVGTPVISPPCVKAVIYSQPSYQGTSTTINKNNQQNVTVSKDSGSIKVEGGCKVELYQYAGCSGQPMCSPISNDQPDITSLYLDYDIQCINVRE